MAAMCRRAELRNQSLLIAASGQERKLALTQIIGTIT